MITRKQIGDFVFIKQTTYYMYVAGNDKPVLTTSDPDLFNRQKRLAKTGKISARKKKQIINLKN